MNYPLGLRILTTTVAGVMTISMAACSKPVDASGAAAPGTTVGTDIDDSVITTRIKTALLNDASIKSLDISVSTHKTEVQLSGFVNNQSQIDRAMQVAKAVSGVTQVGNDLIIKK